MVGFNRFAAGKLVGKETGKQIGKAVGKRLVGSVFLGPAAGKFASSATSNYITKSGLRPAN